MGNLRFPKVFVIDPVGSNFITGTTIKPPALTPKQVGVFNIDQFGVTIGGSGSAPAPAAVRRMKIAQNVGDSDFGTTKTQIFNADGVVGWMGFAATAPATQISYIGWDEVDGTKDINATCNQDLIIPFHLYEKRMATWYGRYDYNKVIVVNTGCCPDCGSPCTAADKLYIANQIALQINMPNNNPTDMLASNELNQYVLATVVTNGLTGTALRVGVKVETLAVTEDQEASLSSCNPQKWWEFRNYSFTIGNQVQGICNGTQLNISTTQVANQGSGYAAGVAALEAESQGYDRVRTPSTEWPYSNLNGYKIFATAGTKYDYYILNYDYKHRLGGGITPYITEPYEAIIIVPTGTGGPIQTLFNTWLAGKFPAVVL